MYSLSRIIKIQFLLCSRFTIVSFASYYPWLIMRLPFAIFFKNVFKKKQFVYNLFTMCIQYMIFFVFQSTNCFHFVIANPAYMYLLWTFYWLKSYVYSILTSLSLWVEDTLNDTDKTTTKIIVCINRYLWVLLFQIQNNTSYGDIRWTLLLIIT